MNREKISTRKKSKKTAQNLLQRIKKLASHNSTVLKNWDSLQALKEIRKEN